MIIGFIGLGRMGKNMVLNLLDHKQTIIAYNRTYSKTLEVKKKGALATQSIEELITKLPKRKVIWLMLPAGHLVDKMIKKLRPHLSKNDILIDGGNSFYMDSVRRSIYLKKKGVNYLDVGTSGGMNGARFGACMMIGGEKKSFKYCEKLFSSMCVKNGYGYMGKSGAGHFVKMVHNGIEYGMMGAIAEGMNAVNNSVYKPNMNEVIKVYNSGSIVESKLTNWLYSGMKDSSFKKISGTVPKGETEEEMIKLEKLSKMLILKTARMMRVETRKKPNYMGKLLATMRNQFGGHNVIKK